MMISKPLRYLLLLLLGIGMVLSAPYLAALFNGSTDKLSQSVDFALTLDQKTNRTLDLIRDVQLEIREEGAKRTQLRHNEFFRDLFENEGIMLAVFHNDQLALWTHNALPPVGLLRAASLGGEIYKFENGWYRLLYLTDGVDEYCGAILLKHSYAYENVYLNNAFQKDFRQPSLVEISTKPAAKSVKLLADKQPFYLIWDDLRAPSPAKPITYILLSIIGGIFIAFALVKSSLSYARRRSPILSYSILLAVLILLRYLSLKGGWPGYVDQIELFNPTLYASSLIFPSLADFCMNAILILGLSLFLRFRASAPVLVNAGWSRFILILGVGILLLFSAWVNSLAKGIVLNSNIPFDINGIAGLNRYSILAILSVGMLYAAVWVGATSLVNFAKASRVQSSVFLLILAIATLAHVLISHGLGVKDLLFILWPVVMVLGLLLLTYYERQRGWNLGVIIIWVAFFALLESHNFLKYSQSREHAQRQIMADKMAVDDDPVAELLFVDLAEDLIRDADIKKVFEENELHTRETLEDFIVSRYFTGYWGKYDITLHPFLSDSSVWGKLSSVRPITFSELQKRIDRYGQASEMSQSLYYIYNADDAATYIALLPLNYSLSAKPDGILIFELKSKLFPQQLGFPSLLIDSKSKASTDPIPYATARYVDGRLLNSAGGFSFQSHPGNFDRVEAGKEYILKRGYEHLVSRVDKSTLVILSKPMTSYLDRATTFSYLFIMLGAGLSICIFLAILAKFRLRKTFNLNQKIQGLLVTLTLTTLLLFAYATQYFIGEKYNEKNEGLISEKLQSVLLELKSKLGEEETLTYDISDMLNRLLSKFSYIFFADVNLYDPDGNLLSSSQMRLYNEGLLSRKIDPTAFAHVSYLDQVEYIHDEQIGNLSYLSGYTPFYSERGILLGYLNIPYFAKQQDLESEISSFLVSVINIFVLLFLLSILVGLFVSQWITKPLRAIRESLSAIDLGKTNKMIGYSGSDEIGRLVQEYNAKVAELERNAEKLAQSERESAWREMAKQVAHEIKNPLTPMKLSVQHLERTVDQGKVVNAEQIKRLSANLVEQIDALSAIASAFSNFARMPKANLKIVELPSLLLHAADLFQNADGIEIIIAFDANAKADVVGDKEQLLRVFNNLIKNAIQSIPDDREGTIRLSLIPDGSGFQLAIMDNGKGIPELEKQKIFEPNFTTKSRGMGLGLAMAKNSIESFGGRIWFETEPEVGSTFYLWLPRAS